MGYILTGRDEDGNEYLMHYGTKGCKPPNKSKIKNEKKDRINVSKSIKKANNSFKKDVTKGRVNNLKRVLKRHMKKA